ncbi:MAG: hypothetical protein ACLUOI_21750 [Eisenbergiella sp.]
MKGLPFADGKSLATVDVKMYSCSNSFHICRSGYVYGKITGTIKTFKDALDMMAWIKYLTVLPDLALACQFVAVFAKVILEQSLLLNADCF